MILAASFSVAAKETQCDVSVSLRQTITPSIVLGLMISLVEPVSSSAYYQLLSALCGGGQSLSPACFINGT